MDCLKGNNLEELTTDEICLLVKEGDLPSHIAIIMDGNGRWAEKRGLPRLAGHREGIKSVRDAVTLCRELGISALTIYAFSVENWMRPRREVVTLMNLLEEYLQRELKTLLKNEVRFKTIGRIEQLPASVIRWIKNVEKKTEKNDKMILTLALSYSGRTEITDAVNKIINDYNNGSLKDKEITEHT
ncbi:MAG: polyprenyl diphosphate synthase, partial [Nitrospirota bacterium]